MTKQTVDLSREVARLEKLLEAGDATRGMRAQISRGGIIVYRFWVDEPGSMPSDELDLRFRLTKLGAGAFALAIRQTSRWEKVPFAGTLEELTEVMNGTLAHWAIDIG